MKVHKQKRRVNIATTDPAWEAMKAARRNLNHDEAVQESNFLTKQFYSLWGHLMPASPVELNAILRTLTDLKIRFVLTGAHGIGGWTGRPRSTKDVDILVKGGRTQARAVKAIKQLYPELEVRDFTGVTAFFLPGENQSVIDITYPHRADLQETLDNPVWAENKAKGLKYRIPSLECALANKYGAMLTLSRESRKRRQDILDFEWMVTHSLDEGQPAIDLENLELLGEKVWPSGGGKEILCMVELVKAGKAISLNSLGLHR
jgi:hypothetical protein